MQCNYKKCTNYTFYDNNKIHIFIKDLHFNTIWQSENVINVVRGSTISLRNNYSFLNTPRISSRISYLPKISIFKRFYPGKTTAPTIGQVNKIISFFSNSINKNILAEPSGNALDLNIAISVALIYESIFNKISTQTYVKIENIKNSICMAKTLAFLRADPTCNTMLHKKFISNLIPKTNITMSKQEVLNFMKIMYEKYPTLKYNILVNENTSYVVIYEMFAAFEFGYKQDSVQSITFLPENASRTLESQKESLALTKQKNCDLEVLYTSNNNKIIHTLLDILIGHNKEYKGNLIFTSSNNIRQIENHYKQYLFELNKLSKIVKAIDKESIIKYETNIKEIWTATNITISAKILQIQEVIIDLLPLWRKYNPSANPNMIAFIPETTLKEGTLSIAEKIQKDLVPILPFHNGIKSDVIEGVISNSLRTYLKYRPIDFVNMPEKERLFCLQIIKKYAPIEYVKIHEAFNLT